MERIGIEIDLSAKSLRRTTQTFTAKRVTKAHAGQADASQHSSSITKLYFVFEFDLFNVPILLLSYLRFGVSILNLRQSLFRMVLAIPSVIVKV